MMYVKKTFSHNISASLSCGGGGGQHVASCSTTPHHTTSCTTSCTTTIPTTLLFSLFTDPPKSPRIRNVPRPQSVCTKASVCTKTIWVAISFLLMIHQRWRGGKQQHPYNPQSLAATTLTCFALSLLCDFIFFSCPISFFGCRQDQAPRLLPPGGRMRPIIVVIRFLLSMSI